MLKLSQDRYEDVRELFSDEYPNLPLVYGIIEQKIPGKIFVNQLTSPTVCLILTGAAYCFMSGEPDEATLSACTKILREKGNVKLAIEPKTTLDLEKRLKKNGNPFGLVMKTMRHHGKQRKN